MKVHSYLLTISLSLCALYAQDVALSTEITTPKEAIKERGESLQDLTKLPLEAWSTEALQNKARQGDVNACILMAEHWANMEGDEPSSLPAEKLKPFLDQKEREATISSDSKHLKDYWLQRALDTKDPIAQLAQVKLSDQELNDEEYRKILNETAAPLALKGNYHAIMLIWYLPCDINSKAYKAGLKGIQILKQKAEKQEGNAAAEYYKVLRYGIDNNEQAFSTLIPDAIKYLRLAASKDNAAAIFELAVGVNVEEIPKNKSNEYEELLQQGSALNDIRMIHKLSMDTEDDNVLKTCYERLAKLGDLAALSSLSYDLIEQKAGMEALSLLERAVPFGGAETLGILCYLYEGNAGVPANPQKAFELAQEMVDQCHVMGMLKLAHFYETGFGCQADPEKAHDLIQWAARSSLSESHIALARSYLLGIGCKKNESLAYQLLEELYHFDSNFAGVHFLLGYCNEEGLGTKMNLKDAMKFYKEGADRSDPKAMNNLATMYRVGTASAPNIGEAKRLYTQAAKLGNAEALKNLNTFDQK